MSCFLFNSTGSAFDHLGRQDISETFILQLFLTTFPFGSVKKSPLPKVAETCSDDPSPVVLLQDPKLRRFATFKPDGDSYSKPSTDV